MRTSIITTAAAIAGAAFLISASLVSASIEPTAPVQEFFLERSRQGRPARQSLVVEEKGDRLPIASTANEKRPWLCPIALARALPWPILF